MIYSITTNIRDIFFGSNLIGEWPEKNLYHSEYPEGHFAIYIHNPIKAICTSVEISVLEGP